LRCCGDEETKALCAGAETGEGAGLVLIVGNGGATSAALPLVLPSSLLVEGGVATMVGTVDDTMDE